MADRNLDELLRFDSLDRAEKITGKSYKEDEGTTLVGILLMQENTRAKESILKAQDDSTFSNELGRYKRIIAEEGFKNVLEVDFQGYDCLEKFFVYWHDDGILLTFDTYGGKSVNGGKFKYNWKPNEGADFSVLSSHGGYVDGVIAGDHDCREAIRYHIRRLREEGTFLNPWVKQPFLWLLHYQDTKVENYDYKAITAYRIAQLPEHVKKAITPSN